jgi:Tetratricopeptide repeat
VRSRALTMGKIADILASRDELDEARALQDECLQVYRRLGDTDGIASALWGLARLDLVEEKMEDAMPRISESYDILCRLGRADGIAVVGMRYGQLLAATDTPNEALAVLKRSVEIFRKLGREADAQKAEEVIAATENDWSPAIARFSYTEQGDIYDNGAGLAGLGAFAIGAQSMTFLDSQNRGLWNIGPRGPSSLKLPSVTYLPNSSNPGRILSQATS